MQVADAARPARDAARKAGEPQVCPGGADYPFCEPGIERSPCSKPPNSSTPSPTKCSRARRRRCAPCCSGKARRGTHSGVRGHGRRTGVLFVQNLARPARAAARDRRFLAHSGRGSRVLARRRGAAAARPGQRKRALDGTADRRTARLLAPVAQAARIGPGRHGPDRARSRRRGAGARAGGALRDRRIARGAR